MTKLRNFTKEENRDFPVFRFSLQLMLEQTKHGNVRDDDNDNKDVDDNSTATAAAANIITLCHNDVAIELLSIC